MITKFPEKSTTPIVRIYLPVDTAQNYLASLRKLEQEFHTDFSYIGFGRSKAGISVESRKTKDTQGLDLQENRENLYTDEEWAQVQLGWALIWGYKRNKGRRGYDEDYWRGKAILDNVTRGVKKHVRL